MRRPAPDRAAAAARSTAARSPGLASQLTDRRPVRRLHRAVDECDDGLAHRVEALAERLAHLEPRVDALDDDRELVEGEHHVPVERVDRPPALLRVTLDDLVGREEP